MSISSHRLLHQLRFSWFLCPHRKYENIQIEKVPQRIPLNLSKANHEASRLRPTKQKSSDNDMEHLKLSDNFYHPPWMISSHTLVLSDSKFQALCKPDPNICYVKHRGDFQVLSSHLTNRSSEKIRTQHFASPDGPPSDDFSQKIRRLEMKLRSEVPNFLEPGKFRHDFNVYSPNVQLAITRSRLSECRVCSGLSAYKGVTHLFRFVCKLCLRGPRLDVMSVVSDENRRVIDVRWRVAGRPLYSLIFSFMLPPRRLNRYYDFVSVLSVNEDGQIWRHLITKLRPIRSRLFDDFPAVRKRLQASSLMSPLTSRRTRYKSFQNMPDS